MLIDSDSVLRAVSCQRGGVNCAAVLEHGFRDLRHSVHVGGHDQALNADFVHVRPAVLFKHEALALVAADRCSSGHTFEVDSNCDLCLFACPYDFHIF